MINRENIIFFEGHLTFSTIGRLLTLLKNRMEQSGMRINTYKKVISVMVEVLENIYKYNDYIHEDPYIFRNYLPIFRIDRYNSSFIMHSVNPIRNVHIPVLRAKIEKVNSKNPSELKELFRETISNGQFTDKGGAGLGIIEMAKLSGNPLDFSFQEVNDQFSCYFLSITFNDV